MSLDLDDDERPDPAFAEGVFAVVEAALRLRLPDPVNVTLRELLDGVPRAPGIP